MKYTFTDLLRTASQAVVHERHMIWNLETNNKSKTQIQNHKMYLLVRTQLY